MRVCLFLLVALTGARAAHASPSVDLDDPRYDELADRAATSNEPLYLGGFAPVSDARVRHLLGAPALPDRGWLRLDRVYGRVVYDDDDERRYSTLVRPRDLTGDVAVTCEHSEGRPCRRPGLLGEIDGSAGYGDHVSATLRLRGDIDTDNFGGIAVDRLYIRGGYGPIEAEVGRDVLTVGPRSRTQLAWGDHAPPLDQVRLSTAKPFPLVDGLEGNVLYVVGRLRDPQRFRGNLVTLSRLQADIADRVEVGVQQLLQLGGEGAAPIGGPIDFVLEHIRRRDLTASATDSSNRRFGGDVAWHIPDLYGARLYYAVMFEDIRAARWMDAIRYDADHLFGVEVQRVTVEYHQTGVRSQEHSPRTTGLTNANRVAGAPLGPDAKSLYTSVRLPFAWGELRPWLEYARLASDTYLFEVDGPISLTRPGAHEFRYRAGARARIALRHALSAEAEVIVEHVSQLAFAAGDTANNVRLGVALVYRAP